MAMVQATAEQTLWQIWLTVPEDLKWQFLAVTVSPGIAAVAITIIFVSTLRHMLYLNDKQAALTSLISASIYGGATVYFMGETVNDIIGFDLYDTKTIAAGVFLSPPANFITFKIITLSLYCVYQIAKAAPEKHTLAWLGVPAMKIANMIHITLTAKPLFVFKQTPLEDGDTETDTETKYCHTQVYRPEE